MEQEDRNRGLMFPNTLANREALRLSGIRLELQPRAGHQYAAELRQYGQKILVRQVDPQNLQEGEVWEEYVTSAITRSLHALLIADDQGQLKPMYKDWTCTIYAGKVLYVEFHSLTRETLSFQFGNGGEIRASRIDDVTEEPLAIEDASPLVALAKRAHAMYTHRGPVENPKIPDEMLARVKVDAEFTQRLIAGRRLVVLADWDGMPPRFRQLTNLQNKLAEKLQETGKAPKQEFLVSARLREAALMVASPSGHVSLTFQRAVVEKDELGFAHVVSVPAPEPKTFNGHFKDPALKGERWRRMARAAVEAAQKAVDDPKVAERPITWGDPSKTEQERRTPPKPETATPPKPPESDPRPPQTEPRNDGAASPAGSATQEAIGRAEVGLEDPS